MTITDEYQPSLLDPPRVEVVQGRMTHDEAWNRFRRRNPWFMRRCAELAYEQRAIGRQVSTKLIFELLRSEVDESGSPFKLDNSWSALCARLLVEQHPDLDGYVRLRKRRGE